MNTSFGGYWVDFFNLYGKRIIGASVWAGSAVHAHEQANACCPQGDDDSRGVSYTINQCLFNSLDTEQGQGVAHNDKSDLLGR